MGRHLMVILGLCMLGIFSIGMTVQAGVYNNPYVTFSPDGNAFTTNAEDTDTEWYESGKTIYTGEVSTLSNPKTGEHLYLFTNSEEVRIGKWVVTHARGSCIHDAYPNERYYYGVPFGTSKCLKNYYSGWFPYCADCGEVAVNLLFYMSDDTAASIKSLDMSLAYYYRCPWCTNLEQAWELKQHTCQKISANQYSVRYHANFGSGYMAKSIHMYNNCSTYEGKEVTPQKNLNQNSYIRTGYEFVGWNTKIDGSGQAFDDGAEILNLCEEEQGNIILYAQWKKSSSSLCIDPNGGTYKGSSQIFRITGDYGSSYLLNNIDMSEPSGATVHFDTQGGDEISDRIGNMMFAGWSFTQPLKGAVEDNIYYFVGPNACEDYVKAVYEPLPITLPMPHREGYSFGGWFLDEEYKSPVGTAGSEFVPSADVTLYAQWVNLQLTSEDNYNAYDGKGAVDLSWSQSDSKNKIYLLYQRTAESDWLRIHSADDISEKNAVRKEIYYTGKGSTYTIPYNGYYRLTLMGAQGGNYGNFSGGKGGLTTALLYFSKGEILNCIVGGQNGYGEGGSASLYGNGGGYTAISTQSDGFVLIAGGGGGATLLGNGQEGGLTLCNVSGIKGESGAAGGGGGYQGGACGKVNIHNHNTQCKHMHIGSEDKKGGCYTVPVSCQGTSFIEEAYKEIFYYGNIDNDGNATFCVRCGSDDCPGHRDTYYHYRCTKCGTVYGSSPGRCTAMKRYGLGCGSPTYVCGYKEGEIISAQPAYGGTNYVLESRCINYEKKPGVNSGNGSILIEAVNIGFQSVYTIEGVKAMDAARPEPINEETIQILPVDENKVNVYFARPKDNGTTYYHKAESYNVETNQLVSTSNMTVNTLMAGISGYRYCVNENGYHTVTQQDAWYGTGAVRPYLGVRLGEHIQYLHVAAQDQAGNLSETVHIRLSPDEILFWPIVTEPIEIKETSAVYNKPVNSEENDRIYYVKADGSTPVTVSFAGRICGVANKNYQINRLHFQTQNVTANEEEGELKIQVPMLEVIMAGNYTYGSDDWKKQYENAFCLEDASFTQIKRSDYCKTLNIKQAFRLAPELDGELIRLTPKASVVSDKIQMTSDQSMDIGNSIYLLADGVGPEITGLEIPETDRKENAAKWEYSIVINAADSGSGLKEFWLEIQNKDNGGYVKIEDTDHDGNIEWCISSEQTIYLGEFSVIAKAVDQVGNQSALVYGLDGIAINAWIENQRNPGSTMFKRGESGMLKLEALGYVDRVEVSFPAEWIGQGMAEDRIFEYSLPDYLQAEEVDFMVPLDALDGPVTIIVKAYKDEEIAEVDPKILTIHVNGSVLDELRTRLR